MKLNIFHASTAAIGVISLGLLATSLQSVLADANGIPCTHSEQAQSQQDANPPRQPSDANNQNSADSNLITLPSGWVIPVRLSDEVNSHHDKAGELYTGTVDPSVLIQDHVVIPRGTEAHVRLVDVKKGGHIHGKARVRLELVSLIINGERLGVETDLPSKSQSAAHAKASAEVKKGSSGGAVTSGSAGAGVAGGGAGAAVGPVIAAFTAAKVDIKPGSRVEFTLEEPFTFQPPPAQPEQR